MQSFGQVKEKIEIGSRLTDEDAMVLFESAPLWELGRLADQTNRKRHGERVFFNLNCHLNPTNVCVFDCKFCAFSRRPGEDQAFAYSIEEILERAERAVHNGAKELHMTGGIHPRWSFQYYLDMISAIREKFPDIHIKAFTPVELDWFVKKSRSDLKTVLERLKSAGLGSMPGGGAEIFHQEVREAITAKLSAEQWLETHRVAHHLGLRTNATMLYGHVEKLFHRVDHMRRLRNLQDETKGFQCFIPLSFQPMNNDMGIKHYTLSVDDLRTLAVARLYLDNFPHIKTYWTMTGQDTSQIGLLFGANDIDGTVSDEKISRMAGGRSGVGMQQEELICLIKKVHRIPCERDTLYRRVEDSELSAEAAYEERQTLVSQASLEAVLGEEDIINLGQYATLLTLAKRVDQESGRANATGFAFADFVFLGRRDMTKQAALGYVLDRLKPQEKPANSNAIILDLTVPQERDAALSSFEQLADLLSKLSAQFVGRSIWIAGFESMWSLMQKSGNGDFSKVLRQLTACGARGVIKSELEPESSLTNSEVFELHQIMHDAGLRTIGQVELVVPPNCEPALWQTFARKLLMFRDLAAESDLFRAVQLVPAEGCRVSCHEYLVALGLARLVLPETCQVVSPMHRIPSSLPVTKSQDPFKGREKVVPLAVLMGSSSLGFIPHSYAAKSDIERVLKPTGRPLAFAADSLL